MAARAGGGDRVIRQNDPVRVAREYATSERLEQRPTNRTGWIHGEEAWGEALAAIAEARPRRVLDAGCGTGDFARAIAAPEVVGVDLSPAIVERARARGVDARVGDIQELPFADGDFDLVVCNWVLYHLPELDSGLAELARVLRPGGHFVGIYNREGHMSELWAAVGDPWSRDDFDCENGVAALERHFGRIERRDPTAYTLWQTRDALQTYLDAYVELVGELQAPEGSYPFVATRRNCILVAEAP